MVQTIGTGTSIPIINPNLLLIFKSTGFFDGHLTCPRLVKSDGAEVPPDIIQCGKAPTTGQVMALICPIPQTRDPIHVPRPRPSIISGPFILAIHPLNTADTEDRRNCESAHCIGHNMRRLRDDNDDRSEEGFRVRKQRKQRPCFSCAGETSLSRAREAG